LAALDIKSLSARQSDADAVAGRVQKALEHAARLLEPKVRSHAIERATLVTPDDVQRWTERQQKALLDAIKDGPVLVN
jgi:replication-associated recombination protein RarA